MKISDIINESPMSDYETFGDFSKGMSFGGKKAEVDRKLVTHPVQKIKAAKFFQNTHHDFRLYPVNQTGAAKLSETGVVSEDFIKQHFPKHADHILSDADGSITVVYVSNMGTEAVHMTPWIMAHRFGHAIAASSDQTLRKYWANARLTLVEFVRDSMKHIYQMSSTDSGTFFSANTEKIACGIFNAIGTQRSSREGKINRPYEFLYELFAQYLGTGRITLNPLPETFKSGKGFFRDRNNDASEREQMTEELASELAYVFEDILVRCDSKIFVM